MKYFAPTCSMKKAHIFAAVVASFLVCSLAALSQDCDALIHPRSVSGTNGVLYTTSYYTMQTDQGDVTFNALTADSAVAVVFLLGGTHQDCVDEGAKVYIRFAGGEELEMANAAGQNCDRKSAIY